jgi:mRNA interferase RelE/StbE
VYSVRFTKDALRFLEKQNQKTTNRILEKIKDLAKDPYASNNNVKRLTGRDGYRLRVGDIRILYDIKDTVLIIVVLEIGFRGSFY